MRRSAAIFALCTLVASSVAAQGYRPPVEKAPEGTTEATPDARGVKPEEIDAVRRSVQRCWNIGALSDGAAKLIVTVRVRLNPDATPDANGVQLIGSDGPEAETAEAFEVARRAILRCGASGFDLPAGAYLQWRDIEMTFNPAAMRVK